MISSLLILASLTVQPLANTDVLEPSVMNEVEQSLSRAPKNVSFCTWDFGKATATDRAIRLVSTQRADGRWFRGTNEVTFAAVRELKQLAYGDGSFKVLMIGNSFSICALKEMPQVAASLGIELDLASLYIGGCSLERHFRNCEIAETNALFRPYRFDRIRSGKRLVKDARANAIELLKNVRWDVVTIQQASHHSWQPSSYHPHGDRLVEKIRELAPQAEIVIQETWSYLPEDARFEKWGFGPGEMYAKLHAAYGTFAKFHGLRIIPMGTAVEQSRKKSLPEPVGHLNGNSDVFHLNERGEFLQGLVWTSTLFDVDVTRSRYVPKYMDEKTAAALRTVARTCATTEKVLRVR